MTLSGSVRNSVDCGAGFELLHHPACELGRLNFLRVQPMALEELDPALHVLIAQLVHHKVVARAVYDICAAAASGVREEGTSGGKWSPCSGAAAPETPHAGRTVKVTQFVHQKAIKIAVRPPFWVLPHILDAQRLSIKHIL